VVPPRSACLAAANTLARLGPSTAINNAVIQADLQPPLRRRPIQPSILVHGPPLHPLGVQQATMTDVQLIGPQREHPPQAARIATRIVVERRVRGAAARHTHQRHRDQVSRHWVARLALTIDGGMTAA
jgi:hypothetical protein